MLQEPPSQAPAEEEQASTPGQRPAAAELPREIGGRGGLEPTRYGDWEKNGRCIDF
jgi:hypothetical protein